MDRKQTLNMSDASPPFVISMNDRIDGHFTTRFVGSHDALFGITVKRQFEKKYGYIAARSLCNDSDDDDYSPDPKIRESAKSRRDFYRCEYKKMCEEQLERYRRKQEEEKKFS